MQYKSSPFALYVYGKERWPERLTRIYVRTEANSNPYDVIEFIRQTIIEMDPLVEPESIKLNTFDKAMEIHYQSEKKVSVLLTIFTCIAVLLSLMGVFGIALFDTQHRRHEIAVRRVLGAKSNEILYMFNRRYCIMVFVCFIIAAPIAYLIVNRYFSNFAYHMDISWWVFAATLIVVLLVTLIIVTLRSMKTAFSNPIDSLHQE